jgi:phosphoglycerate-specific signal transduction histidine kinase
MNEVDLRHEFNELKQMMTKLHSRMERLETSNKEEHDDFKRLFRENIEKMAQLENDAKDRMERMERRNERLTILARAIKDEYANLRQRSSFQEQSWVNGEPDMVPVSISEQDLRELPPKRLW